jgi:hypothetical protein
MCLPYRCIAMHATRTTENTTLLLLRAFASAEICLPSRCLAMNHSGFHASCHNIKMDFRKIGLGGMDWIDLAQDRYK